MHTVNSINGVPIRLTDERWLHVTTGHPETADFFYEILETIAKPDLIYEGNNGALVATKELPERNDKFVTVIYKEINAEDGFVITAFFSKVKPEFKNKNILWRQLR